MEAKGTSEAKQVGSNLGTISPSSPPFRPAATKAKLTDATGVRMTLRSLQFSKCTGLMGLKAQAL
jgi:hypothetical protein